MIHFQLFQNRESHERCDCRDHVRGLHTSPPNQRTNPSEARAPVVGGWSMR